MTKEISSVIEMLEELCDDSSVPKNIKARFQEILGALRGQKEVSISVNRALQNLEEIGENNNLQPYIRTQIWNIASMLEKC